jgi:hypothetical protein
MLAAGVGAWSCYTKWVSDRGLEPQVVEALPATTRLFLPRPHTLLHILPPQSDSPGECSSGSPYRDNHGQGLAGYSASASRLEYFTESLGECVKHNVLVFNHKLQTSSNLERLTAVEEVSVMLRDPSLQLLREAFLPSIFRTYQRYRRSNKRSVRKIVSLVRHRSPVP